MTETTDNLTDNRLIGRFISWCADRGLTQREMATIARRTPAWASLLVKGKIRRLQFSTRNTLKNIVGES